MGGQRWLRIGAVIVAGTCVVVATGVVQAGGWAAEQLALIEEYAPPWWAWTAVALFGGLLAVAPAVALRALARTPATRAAGRAWSLAVLAMTVLTPLRALPAGRPEFGYAATGVACWLVVLAVRLRRGRPAPNRAGVALAAGAGLVLLVPWLWVGALGGVATILAGLLAASGLGALAGTVLGGRFWAAFAELGDGRRILGGGGAAGVTLVLLCAGVGQGGAQLALLATVPVLGFALAAPRASVGGVATGTAVAIAAAGPVTLVAPVQLSVLLGTREIGWYALLATLVGLALAVAVGVGYGVGLRRRVPSGRLGGAVLALAVLACAVVYPLAGHPGFYGDRLLVVLRTQADLGRAAALTDRTARAGAVYRTLVDTARRAQRPLRAALSAKGIGFTPYYLVDAVEVDAGGPLVRRWLARRPDVDRVLLSPRLRPIAGVPAPMRGTEAVSEGPQWNIAALGADRVGRLLHVDGRGITIGSADSGVDGTHPALRAGFRGGDDSWYDPWYGSAVPTDYNGHGTHTLGSAVGRTDGIGVAPGAQWIGCVNLARNMGNPARYLDCLQFMLAPFPRGGDAFTDGNPARAPQIVTNSWTCPTIEGCDAGSLAPATRALTAAGIFVVAGAGNGGPRCGTAGDPPARYADVVSVGATDPAGGMAPFSGRGDTKPDVVAPGEDIVSALPGGYGTLSGTSMAAPQVAGVVALMWSANPRLVGDIAATTTILTDTAQPMSYPETCGGHPVDGAGLVNAYAAVRAAQTH